MTPTATREKRWYTLGEASVYSGLSTVTLRRMLRARLLTPHNPTGSGRPLLIDKTQLDRVIETSASDTEAASAD